MTKSTEKPEIKKLKSTIVKLRQEICNLENSNEAQLKQIGDNLPEGGIYRLVHTPDGRRYCPYVSRLCHRFLRQVAPRRHRVQLRPQPGL
jgi:tRNA U34 5-carboxymethylaminomethyl modifying enzyme MnmG/GidA